MKRAKIMLVAIVLIAIVGSALAFKANKFGTTTYCYLETTSQPPAGGCTSIISNATAQFIGTIRYYYVQKPADKNCNDSNLSCPNVASYFN